MLLSLVSAKHAPGTTTVAALLMWAWPQVAARQTLLVEADPAGGDVLLDMYEGAVREPEGRGLLAAAVDARYGMRAGQILRYAMRLDSDGHRLLLAGLADPAQVAALRDTWSEIASALTGLGGFDPPVDVIVDCGRLGSFAPPVPLLAEPDALAIVLRPTLRDVAAAAPRLAALRESLPPPPAGPDLAAVLVGEGPYPVGRIADFLGVPVVGSLPHDRHLADRGLGILAERSYPRSALGRAAASLARGLHELLLDRSRALVTSQASEPTRARYLPAPMAGVPELPAAQQPVGSPPVSPRLGLPGVTCALPQVPFIPDVSTAHIPGVRG
ncbi:hypothetical protein [Frankia sp. AgKG'84/4]|uniref:hypothetical protein n=1 Tax=Frankia sp. AgKG'84/4 TaxID=573490 RepID=UPI002010B86A|nr:hypothetical protein [Frankia sp. AgKG'84/4]MCL9793870.1 hypothetical protein [Frankia sp. AgKG'84/4]